MSNIIDFYNPDIHKTAGTALVDRAPAVNPLIPQFRGGLLHLVYWVIYDEVGRNFLRDNNLSKFDEPQIRATLKAKFEADFNVTGAAQEAMINMHLAGLAWVTAFNKPDTKERDKQETIFKQHMAAVTWLLWEDGTGALFPLPW